MRIAVQIGLLCLLSTSIIFSQEPVQAIPIDSLVKEISAGGLSGPYSGMMGMGAHSSKQYLRYKLLLTSASTQQLRSLTTHPSPVVRCYAFQGLAEKRFPNLYELIQAHLTDTADVTQTSFDLITRMRVCDYLEWHVLSIYFGELQPGSDSLYQFLRSLATERKYPQSIVALARYHRDQDTGLILSYYDGKYGGSGFFYKSVIEFPSPAFFGSMKNIFYRLLKEKPTAITELMEYFKALVHYKTAESLVLLQQAVTEFRDAELSKHRQSIMLALEKYPDPYFDKIKNTIHLSPIDKQMMETWHEFEE